MQNRIPALVALALCALALLAAPKSTIAAEQKRTYLTDRFQDGDIPTGQDFADTIDSALNLIDDGLTIYRIGVDSTGKALRLSENVGINETLPYADIATDPPMAPNWLGQFGFLPVQLIDGTGTQLHYGFFQISMDAVDASPTLGPAIHIEYLVFEDQANTEVTTFTVVPEPSALALVGCAAAMGLRRRR